MLGGKDEERVGSVKVLLASDSANAVGVAVGKEVLSVRVATIS